MELEKTTIKPFDEGLLKVDERNNIYYGRYGNPKGKPVLFCHGGPGGATYPLNTKFFNLDYYQVILFDQRGCGKSTPFLSTHNNTIYYLVEDMEQLRKKFNLDKVILFGGSFGSTLALTYAIKYPEHVSTMVLRGIFLGRQSDVDWLYEFGASEFYPEEHEKLKALVNGKDIISNYYKLFRNTDKRSKALKIFANYESNISLLQHGKICDENEELGVLEEQIAFLENFYFFNKTFKEDNYILDNCEKIKNIKTYIVHGRYDMICRPSAAYLLSKKLNNVELQFTFAGHASSDIDNELTLKLIMRTISGENQQT